LSEADFFESRDQKAQDDFNYELFWSRGFAATLIPLFLLPLLSLKLTPETRLARQSILDPSHTFQIEQNLRNT
jgi:hypothetical protein